MKNRFYMIGNAHLDPVWMWRWQEGSAEAKATCRSALDRMKEYPDFKFVCSSASVYRWLEESAPEMIDEIAVRVREGRWIIVGGWWVQPDCNLPSGEGFARQSLCAQRYFHDRFGVTARTGYCVDSFGHNGMLPQILKKSGMNEYVFMRPGPHEQTLPNLFRWQAPDGSEVLALRLRDPYCCNFTDGEALEKRLLDVSEDMPEALDFAACFYGVGNHGGGPTIRNIELIKGRTGEEQLIFADPAEFFDSVRESGIDLPVRQDDLQHHAAGCYAAVSAIKTAIRKSETRLLAAEKYAALAAGITGAAYPGGKFREAWENICFLHFHDIAGGCSIESSYKDSLEFAGESLSIAAKAENAALQRLSWAIDTRDREKGLPVVIFNSHDHPVRTVVQINKEAAGITDSEGNPVPCQHVYSETHSCYGRDDTIFEAEIPALGWTTYYMKECEAAPADRYLKAEGFVLENRKLRLEFDPHTGLADADWLFCGGGLPVVIDEYAHDTWSHAKNFFNKKIGVFTDAKISVIENGPVRAGIRVETFYGKSTLRLDYFLTANDDKLTVRADLDWQEKHKMLKLCYPSLVRNGSAYYSIPYGWIRRPCDGEEEPGQMWHAVADETGGLAMLNDSKYSFSVEDSTLCLTAVRSPIYGDHGRERTADSVFTDQGRHTFSFVLKGFSGTDFTGISRAAEEFNTPPVNILENNHEGRLPAAYTGVSVSGSVSVTALKRSEDGTGWILRAVETAGKDTETVISLNVLSRSVSASFGPFEVKTFLLADDGGAREVLLTEFDI
ncbi:MAG: alpha-mannosidase [Oscillospiraceae bacterium]|nr:alpha-mannosidase [Oscillospiraceae bacterium]